MEEAKDVKNEKQLGVGGDNNIAAKWAAVVVDSERKGRDDVVELKKEVNDEE